MTTIVISPRLDLSNKCSNMLRPIPTFYHIDHNS